MMRVTLRQLQTFEAVARLKSFSRAAEEMCVSQPTVSKQIKVLQDEVGMVLIEHSGKKLFLSEAGQELYNTCADWLDTWDKFEQTAANLKGLKQGKLSVATVTTAKYFLPRILGMFCHEYPGIDVSLEVLNRDRLLERLANNKDDLYIMSVPPEDMAVTSEPFLDNDLVLIASKDHPYIGKKQIPMSVLQSQPFIVRELGSGNRLLLERLFKDLALDLNVRMELGSNEAIKQAVIGGLGVSLLSRSTLSNDPAQEGLTILDVEGFPIRRHWYFVQQKEKKLSVVAETFHDFLLAHIDIFANKQ